MLQTVDIRRKKLFPPMSKSSIVPMRNKKVQNVQKKIKCGIEISSISLGRRL